MSKELSPETKSLHYITALLQGALGHNAAVVELATAALTAGLPLKKYSRDKVLAEFKRIHKVYGKEYERIIKEYEAAIERGEL